MATMLFRYIWCTTQHFSTHCRHIHIKANFPRPTSPQQIYNNNTTSNRQPLAQHTINTELEAFNKRPSVDSAVFIIKHYNTYNTENGLEKAFQIYNTICEAEIPTTLYIYSALMKTCRIHKSYSKALSLLPQMRKYSLMDDVCFSFLVEACFFEKDPNAARMLVEIWRDQTFVLSPTSIPAIYCVRLIQALTNAKDVESGFQVYRHLCSQWFPNIQVMGALIALCIKSEQFQKALSVLDEMLSKMIWPDRVCFVYLTDAAARLGNAKAASSLFYLIKANKLHFALNDKDFAQLIKAFIGAGDLNTAFKVLEFMDHNRFVLNEHAICSLLSGCATAVSLDRGRYLHQRAHNFPHSIIVKTSLINMYGQCGQTAEAQAVFDDMQQQGFQIDKYCWDTMISAYVHNGDAPNTMATFRKMREAGISPSEITFTSLLNLCSHNGMIQTANELWNTMTKEFGVEPSLTLYNCMIDCMARAGLFQEIDKFMNSNSTIEPNEVTWMSILGGCRKFSNISHAETIAERALSNINSGVYKIGIYVLLSNLYATANRWEDVSRIRKKIDGCNTRKLAGKSWIEVKGVKHEFIVGDASHPLWDQIYEEMQNLVQDMVAAGYQPDTSWVSRTENLTVEEKKQFLCFHSERIAIVFGLISTPPGTPLLIGKNLRVCGDCHEATKIISLVRNREIVVRDANRFHHFNNGKCSCNDYY